MSQTQAIESMSNDCLSARMLALTRDNDANSTIELASANFELSYLEDVRV